MSTIAIVPNIAQGRNEWMRQWWRCSLFLVFYFRQSHKFLILTLICLMKYSIFKSYLCHVWSETHLHICYPVNSFIRSCFSGFPGMKAWGWFLCLIHSCKYETAVKHCKPVSLRAGGGKINPVNFRLLLFGLFLFPGIQITLSDMIQAEVLI